MKIMRKLFLFYSTFKPQPRTKNGPEWIKSKRYGSTVIAVRLNLLKMLKTSTDIEKLDLTNPPGTKTVIQTQIQVFIKLLL